MGNLPNCWRYQCQPPRGFVQKLKRDAVRQFNRAKSHTVVQSLKIRFDLPPFDSAEPRESAVKPCERRSGFVRSVNDERLLLLAQEQQAQRMIDICVRQKNTCDRS